jgi:hypothetical protein
MKYENSFVNNYRGSGGGEVPTYEFVGVGGWIVFSDRIGKENVLRLYRHKFHASTRGEEEGVATSPSRYGW